MDVQGAVRGLAWVVGGIVALLGGFIVLVVAINASDRPPSASAVRLQRVHESRAAVADADNGYVYALGMGAPAGQDVRSLGSQRLAWLQARDLKPAAARAVMPGRDVDLRRNRDARVAALAAACTVADARCAAALEGGAALLGAWLEAEGWLLQRYGELLAHRRWREPVPRDVHAPLISYTPVLEGQKLLLLDAWRHADAADATAVRMLLEQDLRFWRTTLASSDLLLTKMVAVAAIKRHFTFARLALRELDAAQVAGAIPPAWREPLTADERSLLRALAGEWRFADAALRAGMADAGAGGDNAFARWVRPRLLQEQDTRNRFADSLASLADHAQVPYEQLPGAMLAFGESAGSREPAFHLYNPIGRAVAGIGRADYTRYAARVADLEGLRRLSLLAARAQGAGLDAAGMPADASSSGFRDPYSGEPFGWDAGRGELVFRGAEAGDGGRHVLLF